MKKIFRKIISFSVLVIGLIMISQIVAVKSSLAAVDISVDASTASSDFKNISGGANTDSATQDDLNKFITQVGDNLFRIKTWTWKINESLSNYFVAADGVSYIAELKSAVDAVHSGGGKTMMQFYGMPQWLSSCTGAGCGSVISNNVPEYSKYPPTDYVRWQELVSGMIKKLQDNGVQIDYFEIYGEPNFGSTWWGQGGISARPSFYEHYRQTDQAIRKILPTAKVGGSAFGSVSTLLDLNSTSKYSQWIKGFVDFVKTNNLSLAFFSWHLYSPRTDIFKQDAETLRNYLDSQGLSSVPLFLTEWGVDGGANLRQKANTHFGASFAAAALMDISHSASVAQTFYGLAGDSFGLIKKDHQIKPAFNAFQLYSMLKGKELTVNSTEPEYSLAFSNTSIKQKDIRSVAVKNNNEISVLTTYYLPVAPEQDPSFTLTKNINLAITKIPFSKYSYKIYLIDQNHSNGYAGGNPELAITEQGESSGDFKKAITLPIYGTVMVKLTAVVDTTAPVISIASPTTGSALSGIITINATASDDSGIAGVQFKLDGVNIQTEDTSFPYSISWDTTTATNASHTLTAIAKDTAGNQTTSVATIVTINNPVPSSNIDLVVENATIPSSAKVGEEVILGFNIMNRGDKAYLWQEHGYAYKNMYSINYLNATNGYKSTGRTISDGCNTTVNILPGAGCSVKVGITFNEAGAKKFTISGDYANMIPESNENNNTATVTTTIGSITTPSVEVLSPNGGETWQKGKTQEIKWQDNTPIPTCPIGPDGKPSLCTPPPKQYDINLLATSIVQCLVAPCPSMVVSHQIAKNISNYSYNWIVGHTLNVSSTNIVNIVSDGAYYTIQVCQTGTAICDSSNAPFNIVASTIICPVYSIMSCPTNGTKAVSGGVDQNGCPLPTKCVEDTKDTIITSCIDDDNDGICLSFISPTSGEKLTAGKKYTIKWYQENIDHVTIGYKTCESCLDWVVSNKLVDSAQKMQSYEWLVPAVLANKNNVYLEIIAYKAGYTQDSINSNIFSVVEKFCPVYSLVQCSSGKTVSGGVNQDGCNLPPKCIEDKVENNKLYLENNKLYYRCPDEIIMPSDDLNIDLKSVKILNNSYFIDNSKTYIVNEDGHSHVCSFNIIQNADPNTFKIFNDIYQKDKNNVYYNMSYWGWGVPSVVKYNTDAKSFVALDGGYAKDNNNVYYVPNLGGASSTGIILVANADQATFEVFKEDVNYAIDKDNIFFLGEIIDKQNLKISNNNLYNSIINNSTNNKIITNEEQIKQINTNATRLHDNNIDAILAELKQLRDIVKEQASKIKYMESLIKDVKQISATAIDTINHFITYGVDENTQKLGAGERAAVMSSFKQAFNKLPETEAELSDAIKIANGRWPSARNEEAEKVAKEQFKKIYKRIPDMDNGKDNAAITVMTYGLRQKAANRNLASEKKGIVTFKSIYGYTPKETEDWNIMQAITYSGSTRGVDTDKDFLPDSKEIELGTNPNKKDTDGDGYLDGDEVNSGFDPLKK